MKKILIDITEKKKQYPIIIGENILQKIATVIDLKDYSSIVILTDEHVKNYYLETAKKSLPANTHVIIIPAGEKEKNVQTVINIWSQLQQYRVDRKSLIINLGGGVIGDIGGFAASTFLRGVDFIQIPTTLLAQVDASVGGKVGVNFNHNKNYIGSFQQPVGVIIDIQTLTTLPKREYLEGFGEIIKHGLILDKTYFDFVTSKKPENFTSEELIEIIAKSGELKAHIITQDEKENKQRKILNFGHTIGHAIESVSLQTDKPLLHGEAVLLGMIVETKISELAGILSKKESAKINDTLIQIGLPVKVENITIENILEKIQKDKKNEQGKIKWTLIKKIGQAVVNQEVNIQHVQQAIKEIIL